MRAFIGKSTRLVAVCRRIASFADRWWVTFAIRPVLVTFPLTALVFYFRLESVQTDVNGHLPSWLINLLATHTTAFLVAAAAWAYLITVTIGWFANCAREHSGIDLDGLMGLYATFERIVGAKEDRFRNALTRVEQKQLGSDPRDVFPEITRPDQQIALLVTGLKGFFDSIDKSGVNFKVTLAAIQRGVPVNWFFFDPSTDPPKTPLEILQAPNSSICRAVKTKDLVVIEDFVREASKEGDNAYVPDPSREVEDGSLICYPIFDPIRGQIPYVLSVVADKKKYFKAANAPLYKWALGKFAVRIRLEHHLLALKEKATSQS